MRVREGARERLRVLVVEDRQEDAELIRHELRESGFELDWICVDREGEFIERLGESWDVVLSDYTVPSFGALRALEIVRERGLDLPFIVVTGSISEEVAVECMKRGASDYLLKDRLVRLGPAVRQVLRERRLRDENRRKEEELLRQREELRQSQKMEAIGRLAGGVAHDFNNVLTAILGYCDLLEAPDQDPQQRHVFVEEIRGAAERAAALTGQLLAFSRKQVLNPSVLDLNSVVSGLSSLIRRLIGEDVHLVADLADGLGAVRADRGQIEQVLMNLVVNARDAMPSGGWIRIETRNVVADSASERPRVQAAPGTHVLLAVRDSGMGMDEATKARIFEPFFTTKPIDKGTGLGLSTVYGIVSQSGGAIYVDTKVNAGTSFEVVLPRTEETAVQRSEQPRERLPAAAPATLLVVEDEEMLRRLLRQVLAGTGYTVLEAKDGTSALALAGRHEGRIDLLVTDLVMPGMSGSELAERLLAARPGTKALVMSGYTEHSGLSERGLPAGLRFLRKPFTPNELLVRVREVLGS